MKAFAFALAALTTLFMPAAAQPSAATNASKPVDGSLVSIFGAPIEIERIRGTTRIPLDIHKGKLSIHATLNGRRHRFFFDTGSPTILSKLFADQLDLKVIGRNTGRDANGRVVSMDVAIVDTLNLGGVTFRNVPVLIHDYSESGMGTCLIEGGVIGSEILPGSVWKIDPDGSKLLVSAPDSDKGPAAGAVSLPLHDFGYPHAPIIDYRLGGVLDRLLFDTGNAGELVLFDKVADEPSVRLHRRRGSERAGRGSEGVSAGGAGEIRRLHRFIIDGLELGDARLAGLRASTRTVAPTLLGTGILETYAVTLDYPRQRIVLHPRKHPAMQRKDPGYAISVDNGSALVSQLFDDSPAAAAGLRLGDHVNSINGKSLASPAVRGTCETTRWLVQNFDARSKAKIVVTRNGKIVQTTVPTSPYRSDLISITGGAKH